MGGLSNYISECSKFLTELAESPTSDELAIFRDELSKIGRKGWVDWVGENDEQVAAFVASTVSARRAKRGWQDPMLRCKLTLAAYQHVCQARAVLRVLHDTPIVPGAGYRQMASLAGEVYNRIQFDEEIPEWPFAGKNPFDAT